METFQLIINNIFKIENKNFLKNIDGLDNTLRVFFSFNNIKDTFKNLPLYKSKFELFKKGLDSFLIKCVKDEEFLSYFCRIQRVYHVLNRFAFRYKYKKSKIVVNTDMLLNELQENEQNVICIYQDKSRYLFKIYDLLKIINMALINSYNFFANPLCIKNPYSNLPFGKHILYYIYYFITEKTNISFNTNYTELFLKFYRCNFDLTLFLDNYEYLLREKTILNYIKNATTEILYNDIMMMIRKYNSKNITNQILIDKKFPKNRIVEIFKPYLILYVNSKFLLVPTLKYKASCDLIIKLKRFHKFNPIFGREKVKLINKICKNGNVKSFINRSLFNDKHINFYDYDNDDFLKNHLVYKHIHYNIGVDYYWEEGEEGPHDQHNMEEDEEENQHDMEDQEEENQHDMEEDEQENQNDMEEDEQENQHDMEEDEEDEEEEENDNDNDNDVADADDE